MFQSLIEVLKTEGCGILGFQKCAALALKNGLQKPEAAAPFLLLSVAAEFFVGLYEGQPLPTATAEAEFKRFAAYATQLDEAFSGSDAAKQIVALNSVSAKILESKRV